MRRMAMDMAVMAHLPFPRDICRLPGNAVSGFLANHPVNNRHRAIAGSCNTMFRREPTWYTADIGAMHVKIR